MKSLIFIFFVISTFQLINAQTLDLNKQKTYSFSDADNQRSIFEVGDFYYVVGHKTITSSQVNVHILKLDKDFNIVSEKTLGTANNGWEFFPIAAMRNDTLFVAVETYGPASGDRTIDSIGYADVWVVALDSNLDIIWQNLLGGIGTDEAKDLILLNNKNVLVLSQSSSGISGNKTVGENVGATDPWLIELDFRNGNITNQQAITNDNGVEEFGGVAQISTSNHIYLALATTTNENGFFTNSSYGLLDTYIIEYDENLVKISDKNFGGNGDDYLSMNFFENKFYLTGNSTSGISGNKTSINNSNINKNDGWFLKLDENLNILQDKMYGGTQNEGLGKVIFKNNKLFITGASNSTPSGNKTAPSYGSYDIWVLITDLDGNLLEQNSYGGSAGDFPGEPLINSANDIILAANSSSPISGVKTEATTDDSDLWLLELETTTALNINETVSNKINFEPYPNPFENRIRFDLKNINENVNLVIRNSEGKIVFEESIKSNEQFDWFTEIEKQVLFYQIIGNKTNINGKIVKM